MFPVAVLPIFLRLVGGISIPPNGFQRRNVRMAYSAFQNILTHIYLHPQDTNSSSSVIQWGPCDPALGIDSTLSCSFFEVPLDYHNASVGTGKLALIKANATASRRGTMFLNPGK